MHRFTRSVVLLGMAAVMSLAVTGCSKTRHLSRADKFYDEGDYDKAEIEYIKVLRQQANNAHALKRLGMIFYDEGQLLNAFQVLRKAQEYATNDTDIRLKLGDFYFTAGSYSNAHVEAVFVLNHHPDDSNAPQLLVDSITTKAEEDSSRKLLQGLNLTGEKAGPVDIALGTLQMRLKDRKGASVFFERALTEAPNLAIVYAARSNVELEQADYKAAEADLKKATELSPIRSALRLRYYQLEIRDGGVTNAELALRQTIKDAPDYLPARLLLADLAAEEKKYDDCQEQLDAVLKRDPPNADALVLNGKLSEARGDMTNAILQFEKLVRYWPKNPQAHYQLGLAYRAAGDFNKAVEPFTAAVELDTNLIEATIALDEMRIRDGNYNAAAPSLKELVAQHPKNFQAEIMLADVYDLQGNLGESLAVYSRLQGFYPTNGLVAAAKGLVYIEANQRDEARKSFEEALRIAPNYYLPLEKLVDLDIQDKQFASAFQRVQAQLAKDTNALEPVFLQARIYEAQNDMVKAESTLKTIAQRFPDLPAVHLQLSLLYEHQQESQKALDELHKFIDKYPKDSPAWMRVGEMEDTLKNYTAARDAYEKAIEFNPRFTSAMNNLSYIYSEKLKDFDKAYEVAKRAYDLTPPNPVTQPYTADTLGWVLYHKGDYIHALPLEQESVRKIGMLGEVQYHLGMVDYMLDDEPAATEALQRAAKSADAFAGKDEIAARLATLAINPQTATAGAKADLEKRVAEKPQDCVAQARLGAIYQREGAVDKAITAYEVVTEANPRNIAALFGLAQLYYGKPDHESRDKGYVLAKTLYKILPSDASVQQLLGRAAMQSGDSRYAYTLFQAAAEQRQDPELQYDLAQAAYSQGKVANAITAAQNALGMGKSFSRAAEAKKFLDMAALEQNPAQAVAASAQVEEALKANPNSVPALMAHGVIYEQKSDFKNAEAEFEKVLVIYPDFMSAKRHLMILYAQVPGGGDDRHAYELGVKVREAYPDDAEVMRALGILAYRMGDYTNAKRILKASLENKSDDGQVVFYLGMTQYQMKDASSARVNLNRALKLNLPQNLADEAHRVLAEK